MTISRDIFRIHISMPDPFKEEERRYDWIWAVKLSRNCHHYGTKIGIRNEVLDADYAEKFWDEACRTLRELADTNE